jgi:hypothetical protein
MGRPDARVKQEEIYELEFSTSYLGTRAGQLTLDSEVAPSGAEGPSGRTRLAWSAAGTGRGESVWLTSARATVTSTSTRRPQSTHYSALVERPSAAKEKRKETTARAKE